jgi:hypothetical protein
MLDSLEKRLRSYIGPTTRAQTLDVRSGFKMRITHIEHMSAGLPPITDIARRGWHSRKVPSAEVHAHSIVHPFITASLEMIPP